MNQVNPTDVTFMSLSLADFALAGQQLMVHDYYVAAGLTVLGVILVYLYHKFGNTPAVTTTATPTAPTTLVS